MTEDRDPIEDLLRSLAGTPNPGPADREYARSQLEDAIAKSTRLNWITRTRFAWAGAAVLALAVLIALVPWRATPVEAAIAEIVRVAEPVDPSLMPDETYLYVAEQDMSLALVPAEGLQSVGFDEEQLVYQLLVTRERWVGNEGTTRLTTTTGEPLFYSESDRAIYYEAGIDNEDRIGDTVTITVRDETFDDWPTDGDELDLAIRGEMITGRELPEDVEYLDVALDIVRSPLTPLETRRSALTLMSRLDSLQLGPANDEQQTFFVEYFDQGTEVRLTFALDDDGYLRFEETRQTTINELFGLPGDTPITSVTYTAPQPVDTLP